MANKAFIVKKALVVNSVSGNVGAEIHSNDAILVPYGNTGQRPGASVKNGMFRYNTETNSFEGYQDSAWGEVGGSGGGYYKGGVTAIGEATLANNIFRINNDQLYNDTTITKNSVIAGPLTVNTSVTLTINGRLVIT
jgi:hypothetical protein